MKHIIQKILKEEFNPDDLTSPEINRSPDTELHIAKSKYGWSTYIPEIKKRIYFRLNPEAWNFSAGVSESDMIVSGIKNKVRKIIGPHATPDQIKFTPALPKTRSGKIMRRILRKIAEGDTDNLGDISTLADPSVVKELIHMRHTKKILMSQNVLSKGKLS